MLVFRGVIGNTSSFMVGFFPLSFVSFRARAGGYDSQFDKVQGPLNRCWFQICLIFTPIPGEMFQFDYFSHGLKPPPRLVLGSLCDLEMFL